MGPSDPEGRGRARTGPASDSDIAEVDVVSDGDDVVSDVAAGAVAAVGASDGAADDDDDDVMSCGDESTDSEDVDTETKAISRREQWTSVEQLRNEDKATMERKNTANYATMSCGREPAPLSCVMIVPQDQSPGG